MAATAVAPEPPPPTIVTVGVSVYPVPGLTNAICPIAPFESGTAMAVAPVPSPSMRTSGMEVYPVPGSVTEKPPTAQLGSPSCAYQSFDGSPSAHVETSKAPIGFGI